MDTLVIDNFGGADGVGFATPGSAGIDLTSVEDEYVDYGQTTLVSTGVRVRIPKGYVGLLTLRSGFSVRRPEFRMTTTPGIIDSDYRGELRVPLTLVYGELGDYSLLRKGTKLAQLVIVPTYAGPVQYGKVVEDETLRGEGGFGSTDSQ